MACGVKIFLILTVFNTYIVNSKDLIYPPKADVISSNDVGIEPSVVGGNLFIMEHYKNLSTQDIEGEIWKDVVGYEDLYFVSNLGRIKSATKRTHGETNRLLKECILRQYIDGVGYIYVALSKNVKSMKYKVHRLVALAFIINFEPAIKKYVNHKNGIKSDNTLPNLEWMTSGENQVHAYKTKLKTPNIGKYNDRSKSVLQYDLNNIFIKKWDCLRQIERETGFLREAISRHCRGSKLYSHAYGFLWKFEQKSDVKTLPDGKSSS